MKTQPSARGIDAMPADLITSIRENGLYRCGVVSPNCEGAPVAEVRGPDGICRLLCERHTKEYCGWYGIHPPMSRTEPKPFDKAACMTHMLAYMNTHARAKMLAAWTDLRRKLPDKSAQARARGFIEALAGSLDEHYASHPEPGLRKLGPVVARRFLESVAAEGIASESNAGAPQ